MDNVYDKHEDEFQAWISKRLRPGLKKKAKRECRSIKSTIEMAIEAAIADKDR